MEKNLYNLNNINKEDIPDLLKALPKANTPNDFEYKLMVRIENKDFEPRLAYDERTGWSWVYSPAAALVVSVVVLFFVFTTEGDEYQNPLLEQPVERADFVAHKPDTMKAMQNIPLEPTLAASAVPASIEGDESSDYVVVVNENDAVAKEKMPLPFSNDNALDLDSYIDGKPAAANRSRAMVVGGAYDYFAFNGFITREQMSKEELQAYKARLDSLRNEMYEEYNKSK